MGRRLLAVLVAGVVSLVGTAPALGHVQVEPREVAPSDPVLFTVLVPGETAHGTTKVELKVPAGIYPFSFEKTPGWKRRMVTKSNGLVDRVVWTGRAEPDGFVRFSFLAGTREKEGSIRWPAIQTYADGEVARWIGEPDSENPAPVTLVSNSVSPQNAGGEGKADGGSASKPGASAAASDSTSEDDGNDLPLTIAALLGLFFGLAAFVMVMINRRRG